LDGLKFSLDEVWIVTIQPSADAAQLINVRLVRLDFHRRRAGEHFRQNESHQRGRDDHQQEHRDNDRFPDADNPPIIQKVQPGFLLRLLFQRIHS
jgi:hypothetical protein